jgi:hypothetical protein
MRTSQRRRKQFRADQNTGGSAGFASCALAPRGPADGDDQSNPRLPRLLRLPADRHDVRRRLPDLFIGQDISPGRHTQAPLLSAIGNRLEDAPGVKLALRQIDAASAVCPMTVGTLPGQKEIMAGRNHFRVFEVRNVFFRGGHLSNDDPGNDHHYKSAHHANTPTVERKRRPGAGRPSLLTSPILPV